MSVYIQNFSLDVGGYTTASGKICVDLVDYAENIATITGTYFVIDGTITSGTFSPIVVPGAHSAYRMCYDPIDDFESLMGPTEFIVYASNVVGEFSEEDYYLTYGYKISFDNSSYRYMDFGYQNKIVVRAVAENLASCPKESGKAIWFESSAKCYFHKDLSCSVVGIGPPRYYGEEGLSAYINPITSAYYYGRICRLVVRAKDFAGNEMEPFILVYTIEEES